jgi:hypothetical protein
VSDTDSCKSLSFLQIIGFLEKSGIFFVNDITDNNGKIMQEFILQMLKNKSNWISEFSILKKAFPKNWIDILKTESSVKSIVNIKKDFGK